MAKSPFPGVISPTVKHYDDLADSQRVDVKVVAAILGVSIPTVWRHAKKGLLPKPHKQGSCTRWIVRELREAMSSAEAA
ncbi:hypothetical protein AX768_03720 [Burkholderia sp. PAMC 28687]|uniref:helix-turn-helix transcriptional regulator n=1 Tax=Burkholderia sp. PAMC 28687 TaxID=1795874 RepID=UPI000780CA19|nr:helix-turn-helix domain-containing protein [Burkholderia sp. PAMC 28687]AMM13351.1 hypothetical protein AX768_03720 [Burkholderia sp. PAMC 28687]